MAGQTILALTTSYPVAIGARVLIGAGDASAFLGSAAAADLVPMCTHSPIYPTHRRSGQLGQFLGVPLLALLHLSGVVAASSPWPGPAWW